MNFRWIIGSGDYLDQVWHSWKQTHPNANIEKLEVIQDSDYAFDLSIFDELNPKTGDVFIAFDERFGNFKRMELFQAALERGFSLQPLVSANANVASDVIIGKNVFIGPQAVVGHGCRIDYNSVIHANSHLGSNCRIHASVWVEAGTQIGSHVQVGTHAILRTGSILCSGINIGKGAELGWPQVYNADIADKTIYDIRYDEPIYVYGN